MAEDLVKFIGKDGKTYAAPRASVEKFRAADPNLKIVGNVKPTALGVAGEAAKQFVKQSARSAADALQTPGRKLEEATKNLPWTSPVAAPLKAAAFLLPKTDFELVAAPLAELAAPALKVGLAAYGTRVGPRAAQIFSNAPKIAAEGLAENPQAVNEMAKLGKTGVMKKAVEFLGEARTKLSGLIKNSNSEYNAAQKEVIQATQGAPIIQIDNAVDAAIQKAGEVGFAEGVPISDRAGLSVIKRAIQSYYEPARVAADGSRRIGFDTYNKLRVMVNAAMSNPKLSNQTRAVLSTLKEGIDAGMQQGLSQAGLQELAPKYLATVEKAHEVRQLKSMIDPVLEARNAPQQIAKHLETGSEVGQALDKFDSLTGGSLKPIKTAISAEFFTSKAPVEVGAGAGAFLQRSLPSALGFLPTGFGGAFSPKLVASAASGLSQGIRAVRPGVPSVFSRLLPRRENAQ